MVPEHEEQPLRFVRKNEHPFDQILQLLIVGYSEDVERRQEAKKMHRARDDVDEYRFAIEYRHAVEIRGLDVARERKCGVGETTIASVKNFREKKLLKYADEEGKKAAQAPET